MIDVRQSPQFAGFMQDIGWEIEKVNSSYIYLHRFPLVGYFAKIPRPKTMIPESSLKSVINKYRIFRMKISSFLNKKNKKYYFYREIFLKNKWRIDKSPFNPTTTIQINLQQSEQQIFNQFTQTKRRGVRRARKNDLIVQETNDIENFVKIRQKQYFPLGILIAKEMKMLWKNFYPKNASLLLAYQAGQTQEAIAGILMLFYNQVAYYWFASSLPLGKKLFAPTLLVWEVLKLAKKKDCKIFDFEGIYDERFPKASQSWKGFTKFKEGFGGKKVVYLENFYR